jgi:hypothetical protein
LVTLLAVYTLRSRAGSVSHRQRSWDSPFGAFPSRKVSGVVIARMYPPTVLPVGAPAAVALGRPNRPRFLGFNPSESPSWPVEGLVRRPPDAPLGFCPSRVLNRRPRPSFRPDSSLALCVPNDVSPGSTAPQSINQPPTALSVTPQQAATLGPSDPSRVLAPAQSRTFGAGYLRAMCSPLIVPCIAAG